ncbi:NADH-quinone oxidoreductase subunit NuoH [candidate division BRC1 bacterium HGW-BRC1-1]|jgi:NADH-quinone oxidoreductase subunit H|nr:MAG: NADH-quinone oxidoreductase subunit NuoH [candidate division BRC1 bacterium HGW-BRC1-1]
MPEMTTATAAFAAPPNPFGDLIATTQQALTQPMGPWPGAHLPDWVIFPLAMLAACAAVLGFIAVSAMVLIYLERKISGHIQSRLGPMRTGWHGILQSIADAIKLLFKEDLVPDASHRFLYSFAPVLVFVGALTPFAAIPFAPNVVVANMSLGLFYILAFASLEVIGVLAAGWATSSKWSLYGGMRVGAQMMSYEIPLSLSVLVVVALAGSLNMSEIANQQLYIPFVIQSPWALVAFFLFYISALASAKRAPFDLPEAESELVSGFHTEYSGMRFAYFFLAEYTSMVVLSAIGAIVFLGGWNFPFRADTSPWLGAGQLFVKVAALLFVMIWVRWTIPRVRIDQVMYICLKVLLPMALVCLIGATLQVVGVPAWIMWIVFAAIVTGITITGRRIEKVRATQPAGQTA